MTNSTSPTSSRTPDRFAPAPGPGDVIVPAGWPEGAGALFSSRHGGVSHDPYASLNLGNGVGDDPSAVGENRRRLAEHVGVPVDRLLFMRQVHGASVAVPDGAWPGEPPEVDALVTGTRGLALAVLVADCVPVLLADADAGVVAAAHAGRAGMVAGVVPATVVRMRALGAREIVASLGPAICGGCYQLSGDLAESVADAVPAAAATTRDGKPAADVPAGVTAQLEDAGVRVLERTAPCTVESRHHFSHRRDHVSGRTAGCVWLR